MRGCSPREPELARWAPGSRGCDFLHKSRGPELTGTFEIVADAVAAGPAGWGSTVGCALAGCDEDDSRDVGGSCDAADAAAAAADVDDSCDADVAAAVVIVRHVAAETCGAGPYEARCVNGSYGCGDFAMLTMSGCAGWGRL